MAVTAIDYSEHWAPGLTDHIVATITLPIQTVSEPNRRDHWGTKRARAKQQRQLAGWACGAPLANYRHNLAGGSTRTLELTLIRVAPRELDDDNLRGALKSVRDGITDALGLANDRDERLIWRYAQTKGKPKEQAVKVIVTWMPRVMDVAVP